MTRNDRELARALREELDLPAVPEVVEKRLRQAYAELPDGLPVKRRFSPWLRRAVCAAASLVVAFTALLGLNGLAPTLAESLPFIGGVFQNINDAGWIPAVNRETALGRIGALSVDVSEEEGNTLTVPAGGAGEQPMTVRLREVYYDGCFVFAGVEFQLEKDYELVWETHGRGYDIRVNGESQILHDESGQVSGKPRTGNGFCDVSGHTWTRVGRGEYLMQRAFRVPDALQGADTLDVELGFDGVTPYSLDSDVNTTDFTLQFTAQKTEVEIRRVDCQGMEVNGVKLLAAYTTPAALCIEVELPERYVNPSCWADFGDGINIGGLGGTDYETESGAVRSIGIYAGLQEDEERPVVWRLVDKNGSQRIEEVFVIDFRNGTARVGSVEDVKAPPVGDYACGEDAIRNLESGWLVEKYHADQDKPVLYLATADMWRKDLRVELWQDGELVDSVDVDTWDNNWHSRKYWEYEEDGRIIHENAAEGTEHNGLLLLMKNGYAGLDLARPITVRAYEDSGELVLEEEIQLRVHEGTVWYADGPSITTLN